MMSDQLDMFATLYPPPPPKVYVPPVMRTVMTRAYGGPYEMKISDYNPDPFEIEVRGIPCLISYSGGFCTHTVEAPGAEFWSPTGFHSFSVRTEDRDKIAELIEESIDRPESSGGCGGKLTRWWPFYVTQWRNELAFSLRVDRAKTWEHLGPEAQAESWARHDAQLAAAVEKMRADGIDPNAVLASSDRKAEWPTF